MGFLRLGSLGRGLSRYCSEARDLEGMGRKRGGDERQ